MFLYKQSIPDILSAVAEKPENRKEPLHDESSPDSLEPQGLSEVVSDRVAYIKTPEQIQENLEKANLIISKSEYFSGRTFDDIKDKFEETKDNTEMRIAIAILLEEKSYPCTEEKITAVLLGHSREGSLGELNFSEIRQRIEDTNEVLSREERRYAMEMGMMGLMDRYRKKAPNLKKDDLDVLVKSCYVLGTKRNLSSIERMITAVDNPISDEYVKKVNDFMQNLGWKIKVNKKNVVDFLHNLYLELSSGLRELVKERKLHEDMIVCDSPSPFTHRNDLNHFLIGLGKNGVVLQFDSSSVIDSKYYGQEELKDLVGKYFCNEIEIDKLPAFLRLNNEQFFSKLRDSYQEQEMIKEQVYKQKKLQEEVELLNESDFEPKIFTETIINSPESIETPYGTAIVVCEAGLGHKKNEDGVLISPHGTVVGDGMGKYGRGDEAVNIFLDYYKKHLNKELFEELQLGAFFEMREANLGKSGLVYVAHKINPQEKRLEVAHAGDSRVMIFDKNIELSNQTIDESIPNDKYAVFNFINGREPGRTNLEDFPLKNGYIILTCTDGFTDNFKGINEIIVKIKEFIKDGLSDVDITKNLCQIALDRMNNILDLVASDQSEYDDLNNKINAENRCPTDEEDDYRTTLKNTIRDIKNREFGKPDNIAVVFQRVSGL